MLSSLVLLVAAGSPSPTSFSVWAEPVSPVAFAAVSALAGGRIVSVPLGLVVRGWGPVDLAGSVTFTDWAHEGDGAHSELLGVELGAGPVFHARRGSWVDGFFVAPKLDVELGYNLALEQTIGCAQLAVDAGYQWSWRRVFLALVIGGGLGFGVMPTNLGGTFGFASTQLAVPRLVWSLNLSVLRVGLNF